MAETTDIPLPHSETPEAAEPTHARPRGIRFPILMDQVKNTAPFLFDPTTSFQEKETHLELLRSYEQRRLNGEMGDGEMELGEYYRFALASHHATVATFVPTDVDVHIRFKLWQPPISSEIRQQMAETVLESLSWDFHRVTTRTVVSPASGEVMCGHQGEWFSTAAAANAANRHNPELATELCRRIVNEILREAKAYKEFRTARDGIGLHAVATVIAHNLGDLDRVIDIWELKPDDELRSLVFNAGHEMVPGMPEELREAGELNKAYMAAENHRHFALRVPRCLRRSEKFLLPIAPFLFEWGRSIALSKELTAAEKGDVAEALVDGWVRLPETVGYARALAGMESGMPGGAKALWNEMPARNAKTLQTGKLRQAVTVPEERFKGAWEKSALKFLKLV